MALIESQRVIENAYPCIDLREREKAYPIWGVRPRPLAKRYRRVELLADCILEICLCRRAAEEPPTSNNIMPNDNNSMQSC